MASVAKVYNSVVVACILEVVEICKALVENFYILEVVAMVEACMASEAKVYILVMADYMLVV